MPKNCRKCKNEINRKTPSIHCKVCQDLYHVVCSGVTTEIIKGINSSRLDWKCDNCANVVIQNTNANTSDDDDIIVNNGSNQNLSKIGSSIMELKEELHKLRSKQNDFNNSLDFVTNKIDEIVTLTTMVKEQNKLKHYKLKMMN